MDNNTRRFDNPAEPPADPNDGKTRRIEREAPGPAKNCIHCGGKMVKLRAWSITGGNKGDIQLALPEDLPTTWTGSLLTITTEAQTCADCGYTELYAPNVKSLLAERRARRRNSQDSWQIP